MKFKVEIEVEILDEELLESINWNRGYDDLEIYSTINEVPKEEIEEWIKDNTEYFRTEVIDYDPEIHNITIIEEIEFLKEYFKL